MLRIELAGVRGDMSSQTGDELRVRDPYAFDHHAGELVRAVFVVMGLVAARVCERAR